MNELMGNREPVYASTYFDHTSRFDMECDSDFKWQITIKLLSSWCTSTKLQLSQISLTCFFSPNSLKWLEIFINNNSNTLWFTKTIFLQTKSGNRMDCALPNRILSEIRLLILYLSKLIPSIVSTLFLCANVTLSNVIVFHSIIWDPIMLNHKTLSFYLLRALIQK